MHQIRRIVQKLHREVAALSALFSPVLPRTEDEALAFLQAVSPDRGSSCWCSTPAPAEERTMVLSVIVPVYNAAGSIDRCLRSVLSQQVSFPYEIIVVNDGSTDDTAQRLAQYAHCETIRILHQENGGASAARNAGILCARGEYLCFLDCDDEMTQGSLTQLMDLARENQALLAAGSLEKCRPDGTARYVLSLPDRQIPDASLPGFPVAKAIHHSLFRNLRFPEGYWFEDSIMAQIVHPLSQNSAYATSAVCYRYYDNAGGMTAAAKGNPKALDSLWITMRLLHDREKFGLFPTQNSYSHFLSMVNLTYQRTKHLGTPVAQCVFVVQRLLREQHYAAFRYEGDGKKQQIEAALLSGNFKKYILACARKA